MGAFLGMGPEREWGVADCDVVRDYVACSVGADGCDARVCCDGGVWKYRDGVVLVWGESVEYWSPFVWVYGFGELLVDGFLSVAVGDLFAGVVAASVLA